jgi:hypothetical protein
LPARPGWPAGTRRRPGTSALARAAAEEVTDPEQRLVLLGDIDTA